LTRLHEFYDAVEATTGPELSFRMKKTIAVLSRFPAKSLLDLGCGDGQFTDMVARTCGSQFVVGVDISQKLAKSANKLVYAVAGSSDQTLPLKDAQFEMVLCSEVIEHLLDPDNLLEEINRVLAPNGTLVLTTPNLASWINRLSLFAGFQPHFTEVSLYHNVGKLYGGQASNGSEGAIAGHLRLFVPRSLDALLRAYGFKVVEREGAGLGYGTKSLLPLPLSLVDRAFQLRYSTSVFLIYVAKKT